MSHPVRVHPIFYNRLSFAVETLEASLEVELEIVGRHLSAIEAEFSDRWNELPVDPRDPQRLSRMFVLVGGVRLFTLDCGGRVGFGRPI